jgi:hypothetical protein
MVYVDDYEIGTTPVSTNFTYYGTRKIRLVKEGFETLTVMQPIPTPWYEFPPLDFFSENLLPGELRDQRTLSYQLRPQVVVPTAQLRGAAEDLRARGRTPLATIPSGFLSPVPGDAFQSSPPPAESISTPPGQPQFQPPPGNSQPMQPFPLNAEPVPPGQPVNTPGYSSPAWTAPPGPISR